MKKILALILCMALFTATLVGCAAAPTKPSEGETNTPSSETNTELPTVRVAVLDQQTGLAAWYAHKMGWDAEAGFNIELQIYASGAPANEALGAGLWDIGCIGGAAVNSIRAYDAWQIAEYFTPAGDINVIVRADSQIMNTKGANQDMPNVYGDADSVRGATILLPVGSGHHICVSKWLSALGLTESDVSIVNMEFAQAYQAFISGEGDVFACSYPYGDMLIADGYQKACVMTDLNISYYDNILVSKDFYKDENRAVMVDFVAMILRAGDHFAADTEDYVELCTEYLAMNGKDTSDAKAMHDSTLKSVFLTTEDAKTHPVGSSLRLIAEFQVAQGSIDSDDLTKIESHITQEIMDEVLAGK